MATMAAIFNRFWTPRSDERAAAPTLESAEASDYGAVSCRVRALPNEDVYLFVKRLDNSKVVLEAEPGATRMCWKTILTASLAAAVVIGMLLPAVWGLLAGYQIQALRGEQQRLHEQIDALAVSEARLLSPERLHEGARGRFTEPAADKMLYLQPKPDGTLARAGGSGE